MVGSLRRVLCSVTVCLVSLALFAPTAATAATPSANGGSSAAQAVLQPETSEPVSDSKADTSDAAVSERDVIPDSGLDQGALVEDQAGSSTPADSSAPTAELQGAATAGFLPDTSSFCAWRFMSNSGVVNVAFPDAGATYWVLPYLMGADTRITLEGEFPYARYMSLNTYNAQMDTIDTLRDEILVPDVGSVNPFQTQVSDSSLPRNWTATIVPAPAGDSLQNEIGGVEIAQATEPQLGFVIVRIYASHIENPDGSIDPTGGVSLPTVTIHPGQGAPSVSLSPCATHFDPENVDGPIGDALIDAFYRFIEEAASGSFPGDAAEAVFNNPVSTSGLFPNGDNKYIATPLSHAPDRIVVVRGKAPTFMNTQAGESVAGNLANLRYFSICQNDLQTPYPVVECKADFETALDDEGYYTYVVAADGEFPARAVSDASVTTLAWGSTDVRKVLFIRNMLPSEEFYPRSVQYSQDHGTDPAESMGDYYPVATYCQASVFEEGGWQACFAEPKSEDPLRLANTGAQSEGLTALFLGGVALALVGLGLMVRSRLRLER